MPNGSQRIVAIGASAGGLEAFKLLLTNAPFNTGIAFVLIQHLDPNRDSLLTYILQTYTAMPVIEVTDGMSILSNRVHVIPRNYEMTIKSGLLHLSPRLSAPMSNRPIDNFFASLADHSGANATGIILSGTGTDGALGLKRIKNSGGDVIVQLPTSAKYGDMPKHVLSLVPDAKVLEPEQMLNYLVNTLAPQSDLITETAAQPTHHLIDYSQVLLILRNATGHDFSEYKKRTVGRRVERRMRRHGLSDPSVYANFLKNNPVEIQKLLSELLINVTSFFRDSEAFKSLAEHALPIILQVKDNHQVIRIWDVGCATGEEAYSIAILLREYMDRTNHEFNIQLYATDLDQESIKIARLGRYSTSIRNHVSPDRLAKFFHLENGGFRINKTIRDMVIFAAHNVLKDPPLLKLDLLCCRNVMIYHEAALQNRLIQKFNFALRDGAFLFLALTESIGNHAHLFSVLERKFKIYQANKFTEPSEFCSPLPLSQTTDRTQIMSSHSNTPSKKKLLVMDQDAQYNNQELQSINEELQSANEELETSQEELQSVNEELTTVNSELQVKIDQLAIVQSDIKNLLDNMNVGTIFLDHNLIIRRFTREAVRCFRLIETDIGRPIEDITSNFIQPNLLDMARQVIDSDAPIEIELSANSGVWYLVHIQPYKTLEGTTNGVVLTFTDITKRVIAQEATVVAKTLAEGIIDSILEPLVVLDAQLKVLSASRSFFTFFKVTAEETLGRLIYDLGNKQWDISALRELLETILPLRQDFEGYVVEHQFQQIGLKKMSLNARRIVDSNGNTQLILFAMQEM